jgi:hypothetical protein
MEAATLGKNGLYNHDFHEGKWIPAEEGCLESVRDLESGTHSQDSRALPMQFRKVNRGTTTPAAAARLTPLEPWTSSDRSQDHRGPLFTDHPVLKCQTPPDQQQVSKGSTQQLGTTYYECPGDGVNGCGVVRGTTRGGLETYKCRGGVTVMVWARARACLYENRPVWVYELRAGICSKFPGATHIQRGVGQPNWRPAVGPGPVHDAVVRAAAEANALQRGKNRSSGVLVRRLVRNSAQHDQSARGYRPMEDTIAALGLIPHGVNVSVAPGQKRLENFYRNLRAHQRQRTDWEEMVAACVPSSSSSSSSR